MMIRPIPSWGARLTGHLPMIGAGCIHEQQAVTRRRRVEHHEGTSPLSHYSREGVENRDLFRAGRTQILSQQSRPCASRARPRSFMIFSTYLSVSALRVDLSTRKPGTSPAIVIAR